MKQLHPEQIKILDGLLFSKAANYSDLKPINMENSRFVFHLKKLIESNLIEKSDNKYQLTNSGKEYANRYTTESLKIEPMVKSTTVLVAVRDTKKEKDFLIYKRLKNPFYGCFGFPTEKPKWGETFKKAAERGLKEEANLSGKAKLFAIRHYLVLTDGRKAVEDKLMHAYIFSNPKGKLKGDIEGEYFWVKESELKKRVVKPLEEFWEFYDTYKNSNGNVTIKEIKVKTNKF